MGQDPSCCPSIGSISSDGEEGCAGHREATDGSNQCTCNCEGYGRVCPCAAQQAKCHVLEAIEELYKDSTLFRTQQLTLGSLRVFRSDQLLIGHKLGCGGFCEVHHVKVRSDPEIGREPHKDTDSNDADKTKHPYAIKFLKRQIMVDKKCFLQGATDLALAASFLAAIGNNAHIVTLHGLAEGKIETEDGGFEDRPLFLILDELVETLDHRTHITWKKEQVKYFGIFNALTNVSHDFARKQLDALIVRLRVALEVAEALQFLHSLNIIYRDLKPENFGFDQDGVGKLYDFGLATELKHPLHSGKYCLSGAGSIRYMAPEVELGNPYDLSADVYSYGVLLYEVAAMKKPFQGYDADMHFQHVVKCGERPHIPHWFPKPLQALIKACWSTKPDQRPSYDEIVRTMVKLVHCQDLDLDLSNPTVLVPRHHMQHTQITTDY